MAFNVDTSLYSRIVPLGDVIQQQQDKAIQRGALAQQMRTNELAQQTAEEALKEKKILQVARFLTPETYANGGRDELIAAGIKERSLPAIDSDTQPWIDQLQTGLGLKAKSSLTALMDPDKGAIILDKNTGQYIQAREAGQPLSQRIMPPQIQNQDVPPPTSDYYGNQTSSGLGSTLEEIQAIQQYDNTVRMPNGRTNPELPAQIPDTQLTNQPQMTQIPQPAPTGSKKVNRDLATATGKANINVAQKYAEPLPTQIAKQQNEMIDSVAVGNSIKADLTGIKSLVEGGKIDLGLVKNIWNSGKNYVGESDEQSRNYNTFVRTLERLRNDSLRLNKGVQTEGDAQRIWNELIGNLNDPEVVKQRLTEIAALNERAVGFQKQKINTLRKEYGKEPMDFSPYEASPVISGAPTSGSSGGGAPIQIKGADDYNALPKGSVYIDPTGKQRTKQ